MFCWRPLLHSSASQPATLPPCPTQEGTKEVSPEAASRADEKEVKDSVKSRVVSGSQTS